MSSPPSVEMTPPGSSAYVSPSQQDLANPSAVKTKRVKATIFADEEDNLRFVNLVVSHSLKMLFLVCSLTILITYLLFSVVFAAGNPITDDTYTYDIGDARSVAFDSFTLAGRDVGEQFQAALGMITGGAGLPSANVTEFKKMVLGGGEGEADVLANFNHRGYDYGLSSWSDAEIDGVASAYADMATSGNQSYFFTAAADAVTLPLSETGDFTYWIYEAQNGDVFSPEGLLVMDEAETMFTSQPDWDQWCMREYEDPTDPSSSYACARSLSALNAFKASSWNQTLAQSIMDRLDAPVPGVTPMPQSILDMSDDFDAFNGREVYQLLGFCTMFGLGCDIFSLPPFSVPPSPPVFSAADVDLMKAFAHDLDADFKAVTDLWDGTGNINDNPRDVSLFAAYMKELPSQAFKVDFFFDKDFSRANPVSAYSRSITFWGAPLLPQNLISSTAGKNEDDMEKITGDSRKKYVMDGTRGLFKKMEQIADTGHSPHINAFYFMRVLMFDVFITILANDGMFAALSIAVVYLYMRYMIGSWFLANVGFLEIIMSIPTAWFFAETVFQVDYFSSLNPLCLFIVAAIGADDIFVFMDAYKQSAYKGVEINRSLQSRMSYVYRRAGTAMLITSATTCSAFLCTVASPIASTKSFGIFAALVILMDYALVMTMFCTAVVIYHDYFEHPGVNCCVQCACVCCCPCVPAVDPADRTTAKARAGQLDEEGQDRITLFYKGPFTDFVLDPVRRFASIGALMVWLGVAFYFMLQLEPTKKAEEFLAEDHPLQRAITILNEEFPVASDDRGAKMYFVWGVGEVDRSGVNQMLDDSYIGKPTFDSSFTLTAACQQKIYDYVQEIRIDANNRYDAYVKTDATGMPAVESWLDELKDWVEGGGSPLYEDCARNPQREGYTFPVEDAKVKEAIVRFAYEPTCSTEREYPGEMMFEKYSDTSRGTGLLGKSFGFDGMNLRMAAVSLESSVLDPWSEIAETKAMEQYNFMMSEAKLIDDRMAAECGPVMMTDVDQKFVMMNNQKIFRTSAVSGAMIGCAIAFVVILISTYNFFVAAFATTSILCVLISVVGAVTMAGWTLGTITAILISILAGFSVDYVVHLAHAFVSTPGDNEARVRGAFSDMGVSVMSGMLTSILASLPLFMCKIKFFASFGIFLCATIAFSWTFANLFFMGLLATFDVMKYSFGKSDVGHTKG